MSTLCLIPISRFNIVFQLCMNREKKKNKRRGKKLNALTRIPLWMVKVCPHFLFFFSSFFFISSLLWVIFNDNTLSLRLTPILYRRTNTVLL